MALQIIPAARQYGGTGPDRIGAGLNQLAQAFELQRRLAEDAAAKEGLLSVLSGTAGTPATGLAGGTAFAGPGATPAVPGTPGLLPGLGREQIAQLVKAGGGPQLLKVGLGQQFPEPIDPMELARLDLQKQGLGLQQQGMELERQGMNLRRDQFASDQEFQRAKLALDERKMAADTAGAGAAKLSDIGSFRGQYTALAEPFIATRDAYGKLRTAAQNPSAAGDVALISGYMKMIDPTSVVREGEYATAANAAGIPEIVRGLWNRVVSGERLTPEQRADFARQGHGMFAAALEAQEGLQANYRGIASRMAPNVLPDDAVPDFIGKARGWQAPTAPAGLTTSQALTGQAIDIAQGGVEQALSKFGVPPVAQRVVGQRYKVGSHELTWDGSRWQE